MINRLKEKYIENKELYKYVVSLALPMILQSIITTFVNMVDNIMIGRVGTSELNGVAIANQYTFIFNVTVFGAVSGASIFGTQFFGCNDFNGQRNTLRFRIYFSMIIAFIGMVLFKVYDANLISLFLSEDNDPTMKQLTLQYGIEYIDIIIFGLIPFAIGQAYSSLVRECGETKIPMYGSIVAIFLNIILDYCLIFGKFGFPKMSVAGAAIATVIAKTVEALVVIIWTHKNINIVKCAEKLFDSFVIPLRLSKNMILKSLPLMFNEFLWSLGIIIVAQSYSTRGLAVVAARNISYTITDIFSVVFMQLGAAIGIILGMKLGSEQFDEAKKLTKKLIFFAVGVSVVLALLVVPLAFFYPNIYNVEDEIKNLAVFYILTQAFVMPLWSYTNSCYFVIRSGGGTGITFIFDFVYTWLIFVPLAFVLTRWTNLDIHLVMIIVTYAEIIKALVGYFMVKSNIWVKNITKLS